MISVPVRLLFAEKRVALVNGRDDDRHRLTVQTSLGHCMTTTELIIQLLKIVIGLVFGAYFLWWSLEVLHRLPN